MGYLSRELDDCGYIIPIAVDLMLKKFFHDYKNQIYAMYLTYTDEIMFGKGYCARQRFNDLNYAVFYFIMIQQYIDEWTQMQQINHPTYDDGGNLLTPTIDMECLTRRFNIKKLLSCLDRIGINITGLIIDNDVPDPNDPGNNSGSNDGINYMIIEGRHNPINRVRTI